MYRLTCELVTTASLTDAFAFFEDPTNLKQITPPWLGFTILTKDVRMRKGADIRYEFRWLGIPMKWSTRITAYDPPHYFVDEALHSPYSLWRHTHRFEQMPEGTRVFDQVDYRLPFGPFGALAHSFVVARQLKTIFRFRQQEIGSILGGIRGLSEPVITVLK